MNTLLSSVLTLQNSNDLNLFRSTSVATGKTLSRVHSPTSTASQELQRKCHFWPLSRSCTITLLTYLHVKSKILCKTIADSGLTLISPLKHWTSYHAECAPELSCHSLILRRSPREKCVVSRNMSTPPLSKTGFSGSVRWWGSLSPSVPCRVMVTYTDTHIYLHCTGQVISVFTLKLSSKLLTWDEVAAPWRWPVLKFSR